MATLDQTIKIILTAVDETGGAFGTAAAGIDALTQKVGAITGPMAAVTDSIIKADLAAAAIAVTFGTIAVRETIKFQDSLYTVQKFLDADFDPGKARNDIEGLALAFGVSANAVAESTAGFLGASYEYDAALSLVRTSLELHIAGEMDAARATEILNASLAGFKVPANEAADGAKRVGDLLNKLTDISTSRFMEPIAQGFARVAPLADGAGLSMEETGAIVTRLVDVFRSGEIAGTALGSGLGSLAKPTGEAADALQSLGVITKNSDGTLRSSGDVLKDLAGKWGSVADSQKEAALQSIFGKEQAAKFSVVLNDWGKIQEYLTKVTDETTGAVGSMAKEVEGKMALISTSVAKSSEAWRQFVERVGAQITSDGSLQGLIDNVGSLGLAFKEVVASGGLDPLINALQDQFATLADAVAQMASNLPEAFQGVEWSGLLNAIDNLRGEFGQMFDGVDLTTVDGLRKAIQAIVDTGETLIRVTSGMVDGLTPFVRGLAGVVQEINASDEATKAWAGELLGMAKGINTLLPAFGAMGDGLGAIGSGLQALAAVKAASLLTEIGGAAAATAGKLAGSAGLVGAAGAAGYAVGNVLNDGISAVVATATGTRGATLGTWLYDITHASEDLALTAPTVVTGLNEQASATESLSAAAQGAAPALDLMSKEEINAALAAEGFVVATDKTASATNELTDATGNVVNIFRDANGKIVGYGDGLTGIATKASEAAKKTQEMAKETDAFRIKMEEIASNERIKTIEAKISLDIAALEADAQRVEATFASIDNAINSTGQLLGSLFGELTGATGLDKYAIEEQIDKENDLRQQSFELQKQLAEAEIARIEAQVRQMERGDAAIQIDGTGLEPELEAFMWQILKKIRVKANAEFQDYLLGMAA